ncbi:hypothetical protein ABT093_10000 [Kitasatospora sp. NPDC002551]|uniref:hypothetical protein n=1 Tax=Kitasatospora sp. NPDC002551 TaxID=3154539 RepID=UPI00332ABE32
MAEYSQEERSAAVAAGEDWLEAGVGPLCSCGCGLPLGKHMPARAGHITSEGAR